MGRPLAPSGCGLATLRLSRLLSLITSRIPRPSPFVGVDDEARGGLWVEVGGFLRHRVPILGRGRIPRNRRRIPPEAGVGAVVNVASPEERLAPRFGVGQRPAGY